MLLVLFPFLSLRSQSVFYFYVYGLGLVVTTASCALSSRFDLDTDRSSLVILYPDMENTQNLDQRVPLDAIHLRSLTELDGGMLFVCVVQDDGNLKERRAMPLAEESNADKLCCIDFVLESEWIRRS